MKKLSTFEHFRDDFLVCAASYQNGSSLMPVGVHTVTVRKFPNIPDAWKSEVVELLARSGFGDSVNSGEDQEFYINAEGLIEARNIIARRTVWGKVKNFSIENWISILALFIAIFKK